MEEDVFHVAAGGIELVDGAAIAQAPGISSAIHIALLIEDESAERTRPITAAEAVQDSLRPGAGNALARGGRRLQLEDGAAALIVLAARSASRVGCAVETAVGT